MYYVSTLTGEMTPSHKEAMELYRAGHEIVIVRWDEKVQKYEQRAMWVH